MKKTLVIVESAGKITTLKKILESSFKGKFEVIASFGHIMDLDRKSLSIDIENDFEPQYSIITGPDKRNDKRPVVANIRKAAKTSSDILIATDKDREGEMIAWSIAHILKLKDPKRIVFNAITKSEIVKAVKNPGKINYNIIDAQKTRRELDRIVGFEISPILWKNIGTSLSAGRVQSVVVRLIVDRENEIHNFFKQDIASFFKINGTFFDAKDKTFNAQLYKRKKFDPAHQDQDHQDQDQNHPDQDQNHLDHQDQDHQDQDHQDQDQLGQDQQEDHDQNPQDDKKRSSGTRVKIRTELETRNLINQLACSKFKTGNTTERESLRKPQPPFSTSTLQQEASRKLGMTIQRTMKAAQNLYEAGYITYMRTDSLNLSKEALDNIKKYILEKWNNKYYHLMEYKHKSDNTQEAHEAIRPTDVFVEKVEICNKINNDEIRLYSLIWKRTVASQMSAAVFNIITLQINVIKMKEYYFQTQVETLIFDGFLKVYKLKNIEADKESETQDNQIDSIDIPKNGWINIDSIEAEQEYSKHILRFNEASLIEKIDPKNLNIGRPSTYQTTISKIQEKGYVKTTNISGIEKEALILLWEKSTDRISEKKKKITVGKENNKFVPTELGTNITNFLVNNFPQIMDYTFTSNMEQELDDIESGKIEWIKIMKKFYDNFHPVVEKLMSQRNKIVDKKQKLIGVHPDKGFEIYAEMGKNDSPMLRMYPDKGKNITAPIKEPLTIDTITLAEAVKILEYPKNLGTYKKKLVILKKGVHGLYLSYGDCNVSLNAENPENITFERAVELIEEKIKHTIFDQKEGTDRYIVANGPHGLYVRIIKSSGKSFCKSLPADTDVESLTLKKLKGLIGFKQSEPQKTIKKNIDKPKTLVREKQRAKKITNLFDA